RAMFMTQAASLLEAARTLGAGRVALFTRVALPLARPAIAVGAALALLETLNDIGASEFLRVQTLTVSVYTTWITRSDLPGAAQIALAMLLLVVLLIALERYGRRHQRYASTQRPRPMQRQRLRGGAAWLALALALLPVLVGFVAPTAYLVAETWQRLGQEAGVSPMLWTSAWNTLRVATLATIGTVAAGLVLAWALRLAQARRATQLAATARRLGSLGYAVPGTVLAIGLLVPLAWFDDGANGVLQWFGGTPRMLLMGSVSALVLAYVLRFAIIAAGSAEAGLARIPASLEDRKST